MNNLCLIISFFLFFTIIESKIVIVENVLQCKETKIEEADKHITPEYRYKLCKDNIVDYDNDNMILNNIKTLSTECDFNTYVNPCFVSCLTSPDLLFNQRMILNSFAVKFQVQLQSKPKCQIQSGHQKNVFLLIQNTTQRCGTNHFCDSNGCCSERQEIPSTSSTATTTTERITTTPSPTTESVTTNPTIRLTTIPSPTTESVTTNPTIRLTTIPSPITKPVTTDNQQTGQRCERDGQLIGSKIDRKQYIRCELRAVQMKCPTDQYFDQSIGHCVPESTRVTTERITTMTVTVPETDWSKLITCTRDEGFFRNPFDCNRFYRCFRNEPNDELRIAFFKCVINQVFDGESETCIPDMDYKLKYNKVCQSRPLLATTLSPNNEVTTELSTKHLKCSKDGYFRDQTDCHKFYRCIDTNTSNALIRAYQCSNGMVFDEIASNCVRSSDSVVCNNKPIA